MRLLITTQILDIKDSNLGFFHRWVEEFAERCESVTVICLKKGEYHLPNNVQVLSLGKEEGTGKITRALRFLSYVRKYKKEYDAVFVHMNPEYVVLAGYLWKRWGKKVSLWYVHKSVTAKLRFAMRFIDIVFTASKESFRLQSPKVEIVGHGIDTEIFKPDMREGSIDTRIVTIGRVSPSKHIAEMLKVLDVLYERGEKFFFTIVGAAVTPVEEAYEKHIREEVKKRPYSSKINITTVTHDRLPALLNTQDLFLNFSTTGSMDKAVLEALATGVPVLSTNEAYKDMLEPFGLYSGEKDYSALAEAITDTMKRTDRASVVATLRGKVVGAHSLTKLIPKILSAL